MHILIGSLALFASLQAIAGFAVWVRLFTELSSPLRATTVMGFALLVSIQAIMLPIMMAFLLLIDRAPVQPLPEVIAIMKISECHLLAGKGRAA